IIAKIMPRDFMRNVLFRLLITFFSCTPICWGADVDRKEPIHVEADQMQYDSQNKVNRYIGNVIASQGSLLIRSAQIEIRQDQDGYQLGSATGSTNKKVFFSQNRNLQKERIEGEAARVEYDGRTATLKLVGDAVLRRYRNGVLTDQTAGGTITYNDNTGFFTVESGKNSNSASGRVTSVFTPPSK
ncbi:MAG: lipopolysaccharide transport periplasmic protein LptA, partial [Saezia sp.]